MFNVLFSLLVSGLILPMKQTIGVLDFHQGKRTKGVGFCKFWILFGTSYHMPLIYHSCIVHILVLMYVIYFLIQLKNSMMEKCTRPARVTHRARAAERLQTLASGATHPAPPPPSPWVADGSLGRGLKPLGNRGCGKVVGAPVVLLDDDSCPALPGGGARGWQVSAGDAVVVPRAVMGLSW
jgi:hypothetical protein